MTSRKEVAPAIQTALLPSKESLLLEPPLPALQEVPAPGTPLLHLKAWCQGEVRSPHKSVRKVQTAQEKSGHSGPRGAGQGGSADVLGVRAAEQTRAPGYPPAPCRQAEVPGALPHLLGCGGWGSCRQLAFPSQAADAQPRAVVALPGVQRPEPLHIWGDLVTAGPQSLTGDGGRDPEDPHQRRRWAEGRENDSTRWPRSHRRRIVEARL